MYKKRKPCETLKIKALDIKKDMSLELINVK